MHALLSHGSSLTKHKLKDKITKTTEQATAEL